MTDPGFECDAYIFLSRHKSESQIPTLTAHFPGNFSDDSSYGGRSRELGYTYPSLHRTYLMHLEHLRDRVSDYKIVTEPMHHGPTSFSKPVLFVEIGSSEERWSDKLAVETVCEAVVKTISNHFPAEKIALGFGGSHYSEKFTQLVIKSDFALGAIAPKYVLQHINQLIIDQMISRSNEKITYAVIDWKGVKDRARIISLVENAGLEIVKV
jgi:D-aminoacyl-tRNA deacylase